MVAIATIGRPELQFRAATTDCFAEGPPRPLPHLFQAPGPIGRGTYATGPKARATCARMALKAIRAVIAAGGDKAMLQAWIVEIGRAHV